MRTRQLVTVSLVSFAALTALVAISFTQPQERRQEVMNTATGTSTTRGQETAFSEATPPSPMQPTESTPASGENPKYESPVPSRPTQSTSTGTPFQAQTAPFAQEQGILYVRQESHNAVRGLSIALGDGQLRPLTMVFESWVDSRKPWRFRRVASDMLEDGPHIFVADGSDGATGWWIVDVSKSTEIERHEGHPPWYEDPKKDITFDEWMKAWAGEGPRWINGAASGKAQQVDEVVQAPWGELSVFTLHDIETGHVTTATVTSAAPYILVEKITVDSAGQLYKSFRITHWEWLDPSQFDADFWMNPPKDIPIGPGNLRP